MINRDDLALEIANLYGIDSALSCEVLRGIVSHIADELAGRKELEIRGFGAIKSKEIKRQFRNPKTDFIDPDITVTSTIPHFKNSKIAVKRLTKAMINKDC